MGKGCMKVGVCGKSSDTSDLQDALRWIATGVSMYADRARKFGAIDSEIDHYVVVALFTTVTIVNFDPSRLKSYLKGCGFKSQSKEFM
jgi:hydroxylamine reductase